MVIKNYFSVKIDSDRSNFALADDVMSTSAVNVFFEMVYVVSVCNVSCHEWLIPSYNSLTLVWYHTSVSSHGHCGYINGLIQSHCKYYKKWNNVLQVHLSHTIKTFKW